MKTIISTHRGTFFIKGINAKILGWSYQITVPIAMIFGIYGIYGILVGLIQTTEVIFLAGIVVLVAGYILKIFIELVFEHYGTPLKSVQPVEACDTQHKHNHR